MNKELVKLAFKLGYQHGMEKRADPPNRGLNDPNPLKREVYKQIGYVPQQEGSFLYSDNQANDNQRLRDIYSEWMKRPENLGPDLQNPATPEVIAADWDLQHASGGGRGSYYEVPEAPTANGIPYIHLGPYPENNEYSFRHELGHAKDYWLYDRKPDFQAQYDKNRLPFEIRAWDLAGVPKNNPIRRGALKTYEALENYEKYRLLPEDDPRYVNFQDATAQNKELRDAVFRAAAADYSPPGAWKNKYNDEMSRYGVHLIHDYESALDAARKGIKFHIL